MKKVTKKELVARANEHELRIYRIEQALKQSGIEWVATEPKLKQLDQSIFNGLDAKWRFAAMQHNGYVILCNQQPFLSFGGSSWDWNGQNIGAGGGYDASDWQNSLIERKELTGNDYYHSGIASKLLERGQKLVVCFVSNVSEADALNKKDIEVITSVDTEFNDADDYAWEFVIPINNQGEPLTQSEAGL